MEIKINSEIKSYNETMFFSLSVRQFIFAILACSAAVGIYFGCRGFLETETLSWLCMLGAAPFAALGFVRYNGMSAEQIARAWLFNASFAWQNVAYGKMNLFNKTNKKNEPDAVPTNVEQAIPIQGVFEDGIFLVGRNLWSKTFSFTDINYAVASKEDKEGMFLGYSEILNSLDSGATTKITVNNRRIQKSSIGTDMTIRTRESLKTIKTFDRAESLASKTKNGISSLNQSAGETQNTAYDSAQDYAENTVQDIEERAGRTGVYSAKRFGQWGIRETKRNILQWRNRPKTLKVNPEPRQLSPPQRQALKSGAKRVPKAATKTAKATVKASGRAAQLAKQAVQAVVRATRVAVKASVTAVKATMAAMKGIIKEVVAVYAVRLNLGDHPKEIATFNEQKAEQLKEIFWDMNVLNSFTETRMQINTRVEIGENGELIQIREEVQLNCLVIETVSKSVNDMAEDYHFSEQQLSAAYELIEYMMFEQ